MNMMISLEGDRWGGGEGGDKMGIYMSPSPKADRPRYMWPYVCSGDLQANMKSLVLHDT